MDWDVFISHAWEDKEGIARPLAEALRRKGLRVWYDEFTLTLGDSLRRSIDHGLAQSRYGVVILSPNFFAKEWPQKELDGLAAREVSGEKVILPIWHNITADQVREYSPTLADRVAVSSGRGLEHVVEELLRVIRPASEPKVQYSPEVAQILRRYEGERIKANREDKPDQYFVRKGMLHYVDYEGAAQVCEERIGPCKDLDSNEEFILDIKEIKGSPYNRLKMIEVLDSIEAEETKEAEKRQITISLLKQESATSIRLPLEPEMILIPAGEFPMGTEEENVDAIVAEYNTELERIRREVPQRPVFVEEFEIAKYPVTNAEFQRFVEATGYRTQAEKNGYGNIWKGSTWEQVKGADWHHPQGPHSSLEGKMNHPVVQVSWHDAVAYCNWLSEKERLTPCYRGKSKLTQCDFSANGYRLPTEAEWEKAARGTDGQEFPWGDEWDESKCNTANGGPGTTTPVGTYSPHHGNSPYGVADIAGNVWEWCDDWFQAYQGNSFPDEYYGKKSKKVLRSGSWNDSRVGARCAYREGDPLDHMDDRIGFRCARSSPHGDYDTDLSQLADIPSARVTPQLSYSQSLQLFDDRMCEAFPGARGLVMIKDPTGIKRCLDIVLKPPLITDSLLNAGWIWWWRGNMHNKITTYSYLLKEQIYLIDEWELDIKLLAGYRAASQDLQYVYVESNPLKSSGVRCWANQDIDDMINTFGVAYEDIAVFEGHYISRPEYVDGFANINGQVVSVMGRSKPRKRPLTRFNLLIAPKETRLNNIDFEDKLEAICNQILAGQASLDELVDAINRIRWGLSFPPNWIE